MLFTKKPDEEPTHHQATSPQPIVASAIQKPQAAHAVHTRSVIDPGLMITGTLEGDGELQIDGQVRGDIRCTHLTVGSAATVDGNITADEVVVRGKVTGVIGGNRVMLMDSAHVESEIIHRRLAVEEGAHFEGLARFNEQPIERARSRTQEKVVQEAESAARHEEEAASGRASVRAEQAAQRAPAARREEQAAIARANGGHPPEAEATSATAQGHGDAISSDVVMASPPAVGPTRQTPARSARARAKAMDPETTPSASTANDEIAIGEPVAAQPSVKAAGAEHDRLRARLRT
jgi:cytoskeletal protein CcmA (bactofilin family)